MMDEADTHRIGFRIRAQIGRALVSCIHAWDHVRPPMDEHERRLLRLSKPRDVWDIYTDPSIPSLPTQGPPTP